MKLGIIIINYNSYQNTLKCVDSILKSNVRNDNEIIIVDNGSTNDSLTQLNNIYIYIDKKITIINAEKNLGYSGGINYGIKEAISRGCDYFMCCNNDLLFPEGSIDNLLETCKYYPNAGAVSGNIIGINGEKQKSYKARMDYYGYLSEKQPYNLLIKNKKDLLIKESCINEFDGMVSGACFIISKNTIDKIGLLDENIFLFYEEDALMNKFYSHDLKSIIDTRVNIIHFGSTTIGTNGVTYYFNRYKSSIYVLRTYLGIKGLKLFLYYFPCYISLRLKGKTYKEASKNLREFYKSIR